MLGQQCAALKPYQVAAVGFMACLIQRSVRGCIVSADAGLGGRTIVRRPSPVVARAESLPCTRRVFLSPFLGLQIVNDHLHT